MMDTNDLTSIYLKIRDKRAAISIEDKRLKAQLEMIEGLLLGQLNTNGARAMSTTNATFFKKLDIKPSASDWQQVYDYIKENDAFHMLEKRLTKVAIEAYRAEHDGMAPPGVQVFEEWKVQVRKVGEKD